MWFETTTFFLFFEGRNFVGQAKHNPTAIAAKNGELPKKQAALSKRATERIIMGKIIGEFHRRVGLPVLTDYLR